MKRLNEELARGTRDHTSEAAALLEEVETLRVEVDALRRELDVSREAAGKGGVELEEMERRLASRDKEIEEAVQTAVALKVWQAPQSLCPRLYSTGVCSFLGNSNPKVEGDGFGRTKGQNL